MDNNNHSSYINAWEQAMRHGLLNGRPYSERSIKLYVYYMKCFFENFDEISVSTLKQVLVTIPIERFGKKLKLYESFCCFSRFLLQEGVLDASVLEQAKAFKPKRHFPPKKITVSQAEIEKLLLACKTPLDKLLIILLSQTGLRASEAANLKLEDISLEKQYLVVTRAKWGKTRRVGLNQVTVHAIQEYLLKRKHPKSIYLMTKNNGKPMDRSGMLARLYKLGRKSGVEITSHALRRAFVTINANKGRPLPMLQIACGHTKITTTRDYCMTTEEETIEAMKDWD